MGLQLIIAVETDGNNKSDWIYVKDTIEHFYQYDRAHVKFSPVYMKGRKLRILKERRVLRK